MAISSFSWQHKGASVTCVSDAVIVTLCPPGDADIRIVEDDSVPSWLYVTVDAGLLNGVDQGMTRVMLDWELPVTWRLPSSAGGSR